MGFSIALNLYVCIYVAFNKYFNVFFLRDKRTFLTAAIYYV